MTALVQPIAVAPGTHFETISAVAIASAVAASGRGGDPERWRHWMEALFTKTVRRARRPAEITRLEGDPLVLAEHRSGGARAFAYAPMSYEEFPAPLRRLQVSGLDVDRSLDRGPRSFLSGADPHAPRLVISSQILMTTGKSAAQAAHALVAWVLTLPEAERAAWSSNPAVHLQVAALDSIPEQGSITIRDNGLTEIESGTATVRITSPSWGE